MLDSDKGGKGMNTWEYSPFSQVQQVSVQAKTGDAGAKSSCLFLQAGKKLRVRNFKGLLNFPPAFRGEQVGISLQVNGNFTVAPGVLQELILWPCIFEGVP